MGLRLIRYYAKCSWALDFFNMILVLSEERLGKIAPVGVWLRCEMCSSWYWKESSCVCVAAAKLILKI